MNKLLFLSFLLIFPISCSAGSKLILQTSDGDEIECTQEQKKVLMQSGTIKNIFEDIDEDDKDESIIPLADISKNTFNQIMQCLKPLAEMATLKTELDALEGEDKKDKEEEIKAKESEIIQMLKSYNENDLFKVIQATSFLAIPALLDYGCQIWSNQYELKRLSNNTPSFENREIIEKLKNINFSSIKNFFIKKYLENYSPDVKILRHADWILSVSYSPNGTQIASASSDNTLRIWDAQTGECLHTLEGHTNSVRSACYSPDGTQIVSASSDNTLCIWDAQTGQCLHTLRGHDGWILSVRYSPDGTQLASASNDGTIRIWDAKTGECLHTLNGHAHWVYSASYSPDGAQLASASCDETIRIWDAQTGQCLHILKGHIDWVNSVSYSPDGAQLASASCDKTVRIWDAQKGQCLHTLNGHAGWIQSASYSPDGTQLASASSDKAVHIWHIEKPVRNLEKLNYEQLLLHALYKNRIQNNKTLDLTSNPHLLNVFNALSYEQQAFLQKITPMKLPLTKQTLLQLYNYRKPIAAAGAVALGSLALYAGYKLLKN